MPVSTTIRPVTQSAEVAVNKASINDIVFPLLREIGKYKRKVPKQIINANPPDNTREGVSLINFDKRNFKHPNYFISIAPIVHILI